MPDFMTGAIVGTAYAVMTGKGVDFAIGLAVPVGLLMVQLDVLARFLNVFLLHRVDHFIKLNDTKQAARNVVYGVFPWGLSRAIPVFIMLIVGIAILLRYLPTKRFITFLIVGFIAAAYLKIPMLGVALLGFAMAIFYYQKTIKSSEDHESNSTVNNANGKEYENDKGEYEN